MNSGTKAMKKSPDERMKEIYEAQGGEIRKNISIAAAEIERLRANRKLPSKRQEEQSQTPEKLQVAFGS